MACCVHRASMMFTRMFAVHFASYIFTHDTIIFVRHLQMVRWVRQLLRSSDDVCINCLLHCLLRCVCVCDVLCSARQILPLFAICGAFTSRCCTFGAWYVACPRCRYTLQSFTSLRVAFWCLRIRALRCCVNAVHVHFAFCEHACCVLRAMVIATARPCCGLFVFIDDQCLHFAFCIF